MRLPRDVRGNVERAFRPLGYDMVCDWSSSENPSPESPTQGEKELILYKNTCVRLAYSGNRSWITP